MSDRPLSHLDPAGRARMVDVGDKPVTDRRAQAQALVNMSASTLAQLFDRTLPKGDAIGVARLAGIMAAKKTPELIPLCHTVAVSDVTVDVERVLEGVRITTAVRTADRTGVEMEALVAATVAALTVYDMVKGVDRSASITEVRLLSKSGGQSGEWTA